MLTCICETVIYQNFNIIIDLVFKFFKEKTLISLILGRDVKVRNVYVQRRSLWMSVTILCRPTAGSILFKTYVKSCVLYTAVHGVDVT